MNLFLRLLRVYIAAAFTRHRIGMLDPATLRFRVWLSDQDMFAHMTNSRYLSFGDLGTINYMIRSGFWKQLRANGWFPVICSQQMVVNRMLRTPQAFDLVSRVTCWDDTYVCLQHEYRRNGRLHAYLRVVARFVSREAANVSTDDVMAKMPFDHASPEIPREFQIMIDEVRDSREKMKQAQKS